MEHPPECDAAAVLAQSVWLRLVLFFKAFCCASGVVATIYCVKKKGISWLAHPNAKALYSFHIFWAVYTSITYFFTYMFDGIRLQMFHDSPCSLLIPMSTALTLRAIPVVGVISQCLTMCAFSMERAMATIWPRSYERIHTPYLGIFLGVFSFVGGFLFEMVMVVLPVDWSKVGPMTVLRTPENAEHYEFFLSSYTFVEGLTATIFFLTLAANIIRTRHEKRFANGLGSKYQVKENKQLILTLLPCFTVHSLLNSVPILALRLYFVFFNADTAGYAVWLEIWLQVHTYSLIMPLIVQCRLRFRRSRSVVDFNDSNKHFQQLHSMFNKS